MACNRYDLSKIGSSLINHKTKQPKSSEKIIVCKSYDGCQLCQYVIKKCQKMTKLKKKRNSIIIDYIVLLNKTKNR